LHTIGVRDDFKRFRKPQHAEDFVKKVIIISQPPLPSPKATLYIYGSASTASGSAGWGVLVHLHPDTTVNLWGSVVTLVVLLTIPGS